MGGVFLLTYPSLILLLCFFILFIHFVFLYFRTQMNAKDESVTLTFPMVIRVFVI